VKASPSVSIIGAGNVGSRLAIAFHQANIKVDQICSKTLRHGKQLSRQVNAEFTQHIADLKAGSDVYFLCIPDQHFAKFRDAWELQDSLIVHTSGTTPIEILDGISSSYGVFYPLQTFSREHKLSFSNIPVCLEANRPEALELLKILARKITANVSVLTSEQRRWAHLAAVISSNFSNYMYQVAEDILTKKGLDFELIHPLILETARKAGRIGPHRAQTGPATRGDHTTIQKHIEMLEEFPEYQAFYELLTTSILKENNKLPK
jgi:predicted short-subunit dehydrogenase-like oxidoreductase (DUF2520 family)